MSGVAKQQEIEIYALDMGDQMYGDCLLIKSPSGSILIDGGHSSDFAGQASYQSIPDQLETILGPPPFKIELLVVTHCHSDHIGCLPKMVSEGLLDITWALVADEYMGFGRAPDLAEAASRLPAAAQGVLAALREEDRSEMDAVALADFLRDAATLESRYGGMLRTLAAGRTRIVRYGRDDHSELIAAFEVANLQIIGPTVEHLLICAESVAIATKAAKDELSSRFQADNFEDAVNVYRALTQSTRDTAPLLDMPGKGAAINNQSIVLTIGHGDKKALLPGDMQLAKAEVKDLAHHMLELRAAIAAEGPYRFFKLPHHSSYNGVDIGVLADAGNPPFVLHTGGRNDGGHPDKKVLTALEGVKDAITFARTDRHGLVKYGHARGFTVDGELNDFTPNASKDIPAEVHALEVEEVQPELEEGPDFLEFVYVKVPNKPVSFSIGGVPITIGGKTPRPFFEVGLPPEGKPDLKRLRLAGGRTLPNLLFVTNSDRLSTNISPELAIAAVKIVEAGGHTLLDLKGSARIEDVVRRAAQGRKGVVLIGGYDVIPSQRVDVLDPDLRRRVGQQVDDDPDNFIVWSDDVYGDTDGDGLAEIPVTRLPDGHSAELLLATLCGSASGHTGRFGLINQERPFANAIWAQVTGSEPSLVSGPSLVRQLAPQAVAKRNLYFMLHGDHADGSRFWGEMNGIVEAFNVATLPSVGPDIVFAGCCWGALTVNKLASQPNGALGAKKPAQSIALSFLKSGARAFVGCTGAHYSPGEGENCFGAPLHKEFWIRVGAGDPPAEALFNARRSYIQGFPHGLSQPMHLAIERKIYRQFTCLGLAW